jgi:thiol-disulfide isomerase/thioredoxin
MSIRTKWIIAGVAALALAAVVAGVPHLIMESFSPQAAVPAGSGFCDPKAKPANLNFTLKDMNGVILLDFWATWCGPCKIEIPGFVDLQNRYRDKGLVVLGFSVDDPVEKLKPFAAEYNMNYPVLVGLGREEVQDAYGPIWGIPTTVLISRDGKVCKRHMGFAPKEQFEREIAGLL